MRYLLILIVVGVLPIIGFYVGTAAGRKNNLTRHDKRELEARRDFMSLLAAKAGEHAVLGDNFAVIVQGMLNDERDRLR